MGETKLEAKVGPIAKIFAKLAKINVLAKCFFFLISNKIINKKIKNKSKNNKNKKIFF